MMSSISAFSFITGDSKTLKFFKLFLEARYFNVLRNISGRCLGPLNKFAIYIAQPMTKNWILLVMNLCETSRRFCQVQRRIRAEVRRMMETACSYVTRFEITTAITILGSLLVVEVQKDDVSMNEPVPLLFSFPLRLVDKANKQKPVSDWGNLEILECSCMYRFDLVIVAIVSI